MKTLALLLALTVNLQAQTWNKADLIEGLFEPIEENINIEEIYAPLEKHDNKA
jgi:hypothetical protein